MVLFLLLFPIDSYAQWSFRESIHVSGRCDGVDYAIINAVNGQIPEITGFSTRAECESARAFINSIRSSYGGCTAYASASPCVGHDIGGGSVAGIANPTVGASSQGSSFFYTSVPEEVKNWQAEQDRIDALIGNRSDNPVVGVANTSDGSFNSSLNRDMSMHSYGTSSGVNIGNGVFTGIPTTPFQSIGKNADMAKVLSYIGELNETFYGYLLNHPSDLYTLLPNKYKELTGFDIDAIVNKNPSNRTPEEQAALDNYNAFVQKVCIEVDKYAQNQLAEIDTSPGKKEIDMAILAAICYGDDTNGYEQITSYKNLSLDDAPNELKNLADVIAECNMTESDTGFHAELYFNEATGSYTLAFQGSNDFQDWVRNNIPNGLGLNTPQLTFIRERFAAAVNSIDPDVEVNIVGHSLGGALAGYLGLLTGKETYTFNAEGLNPTTIESIPNYDDSHILAYHSSYEVLTGFQKAANATNPALQQALNPGTIINTNNNQTYVLKVPGQEITLNNRGFTDIPNDLIGHKIGPVVSSLIERNQALQNQWSDIQAYRKAISSARNDSALYRQDSLLIISY